MSKDKPFTAKSPRTAKDAKKKMNFELGASNFVL